MKQNFFDNYHLILNQEKSLGTSLFQKTKVLLSSLLNAKSSSHFRDIKKALVEKYPGFPKLDNLLDKYSKIEPMITGYSIDLTSGSYKRRGSSPGEQNHWSICSWIGENFTGELTKLLLVFLERHRHKCSLAEEILNKVFNEMKMTIHHLKKESPGSEELKSAQSLTNNGHELFLKIVSDSHNYVCKNVDDGSYQVYRVGYESTSRSFQYLHSRCTCNDRVANEKQCVHEFTLTKKLNLPIGPQYIIEGIV